jgi:DNA-binding response OmpR family regulator
MLSCAWARGETGRQGDKVSGSDGGAGRLLVVDDEEELRELLTELLGGAGWEVVAVGSGGAALDALAVGGFDAATLDINLGDESGYELCRSIRAVSDLPILFLTARDDEFDHVLGLELGADDYLTKPFSRRVLLAHLASLARRRLAAPALEGELLRAGPVELDAIGRRCRVGGADVSLSKTEFDLLAVFLGEPARAFDRNALIDRVWGEWYSDFHVIDVTIGRLRQKLAEAGAPELIETLRGVGYRLAADRQVER